MLFAEKTLPSPPQATLHPVVNPNTVSSSQLQLMNPHTCALAIHSLDKLSSSLPVIPCLSSHGIFYAKQYSFLLCLFALIGTEYISAHFGMLRALFSDLVH